MRKFQKGDWVSFTQRYKDEVKTRHGFIEGVQDIVLPDRSYLVLGEYEDERWKDENAYILDVGEVKDKALTFWFEGTLQLYRAKVHLADDLFEA